MNERDTTYGPLSEAAHPDLVGQSEYRAVYEVIAYAIGQAEGADQFAIADSVLDEFKETYDALRVAVDKARQKEQTAEAEEHERSGAADTERLAFLKADAEEGIA